MCATEIIMAQIEKQLLLLWRISNDKKYVHVTIPFLLCAQLCSHPTEYGALFHWEKEFSKISSRGINLYIPVSEITIF